MKQHTFSRALPLDDSWDVIVVGGGPAGCTAAAAAARDGAKTLLIEQTGCLGGMGTSGLVPAWTPFSDKERIIYCGMAQRVFEATKAGMPHVKKEDLDWVPIDPERLKRIYDELVSEYGVSVRFNTMLSAVETREDAPGHRRVSSAIITNKSGLSAVSAKVFIDCTGDADIAAWSGAQFHKGDDSGDAASLMPATHCFIFSNVDEYGYRMVRLHGHNADSPMHAIIASGKYPDIPDVHCCQNVIGPGTVGFNAGHLYQVDNTDPCSTSKALMQGRKMAAAFRDALAEFAPAGFSNAFLVQTGSLMGIRETRRIVGDYELTLEDYMKRRSFEDEICRNSYFIDVHAKVKSAFDNLAAIHEWSKTTFRYDKGESHGIPYRCLTPVGMDNLLVAGRSISAEQIVQGSVRVMPCCLALGEAAGAAAAQAIKNAATAPADVRKNVDVQKLRARLKEAGAYIQ